jgi:putative transposase
MDDCESLKHTRWECKYHVVFIPTCRRKKLYQQLRQHLGEVFRQLAQQKESRILEGHLVVDHVHMLISIPPKYAVTQVIGSIKGKSAIHIARTAGGRQRNFTGEHFWGPWLFRVHGGPRREGDPGIYPPTGAGGSPAGSDEDVRLTAAPGGSQTIRFERFTLQASSSAGGP